MLNERYREQYINDICRFIRIPSISDVQGGQEGPLQTLVAERMRTAGARVRTFDPIDVSGFLTHPLCYGPNRNYKNRPTVIGEIGPENAPALLVMAHSDTVPVIKPERWTFDPFLGEIRDGEICGLGVSDDKWGTAAMLTILQALRESGRPLTKRVIFVSTVDEESGVGNGMLLLMLAGIQAECALYLDGYQMKILTGCLGGSNLNLHPRQAIDAGTSSRHAEQLKSACAEFSRQRSELFDRPFFQDNMMREGSIRLYEDKAASPGSMVVNFYTLPGEDRTAFSRELEGVVADALAGDMALYEMKYREPWFEPTEPEPDMPLVGILSDSIRCCLGQEPRITSIIKQDVFLLINHAKIPSISFGPASRITGSGSFHRPDERMNVTEAWDGCRVAYDAICRWLDQV